MIQYKDTYIREDRYKNTDKKMVDDCQEFYKYFTLDKDSIVMDMGVNIGGFAAMCEKAKVKKYIGIEPDIANLEVAKMNAKSMKSVWYNGVVSVSPESTLMFYQNGSPQGACSGTVAPSSRATAPMANNNKISYEVKNFQIDEVIDEHKPTHLKVDIEGAEIDWLKQNKGVFPSYIQEISFEVHRKTGVAFLHDHCLDNILKDFDMVSIEINKGFPKLERYSKFPKLGIDIKGTLFGVDIFFKRKNSSSS